MCIRDSLRLEQYRVDGAPSFLGLARSQDEGANWEVVGLLGEADFHAIVPTGTGLLAGDSTGTIWRFAGDGDGQPVGAVPFDINDLAVSPDDAARVVAASYEGEIAVRDVYKRQVVVTALHRRVRPRLAAALLTGGILAVTVAVVPTLVVLAVGFLVHLPLLGGGIEWCRSVLGFHASVDPWLGAAATGLLTLGAVRFARSVRAWRRHRCAEAGAFALVNSDDWFAYSLPGPGRRIAVSSGLVEALDGDELAVVLAHERGHARHRHDRHLLAAELAASLVPPLEWLRRRLRFALERWADEEAVDAAGGDRAVSYTHLRSIAPTGMWPSSA